ncbi:MAG TPA: hypothetical protein VGO09_00675 [Flavisolibacter sp.]|nr:hypothetical protein [Flavisolibacter sp.]
MKLLFFACSILAFLNCRGQVTGTKTIPRSYIDLATAIPDINNKRVGPGGGPQSI